MKALTGLSQGQFAYLWPVFSDLSQTTQQTTDEPGGESGTRARPPGGGSTGTWPTMAEKLLFVLYYSKTYPTFDVRGTQVAMVRSTAQANLHTFAPLLDDTLVPLELRPSRELATPEEVPAALQGVDRLLMAATARASQRATEEAKHREPSRGKKHGIP